MKRILGRRRFWRRAAAGAICPKIKPAVAAAVLEMNSRLFMSLSLRLIIAYTVFPASGIARLLLYGRQFYQTQHSVERKGSHGS
jgi:multidrug transporter EmrE-like cation transporter